MPRALLTLSVLPEIFAICRLDANSPLPAWALQGSFSAVIRTSDELSIVCVHSAVPHEVLHEGGWRLLKCEGPLDFGLTGIVASIAEPLADAGVPIFPIATYDTDYVLLKETQIETATDALQAYGHVVHA